jgi:hypothetical protein
VRTARPAPVERGPFAVTDDVAAPPAPAPDDVIGAPGPAREGVPSADPAGSLHRAPQPRLPNRSWSQAL